MLEHVIKEAKTFIETTTSPTQRRRHRQRFKVFFHLDGRCWYCGIRMYVPQLQSTIEWFELVCTGGAGKPPGYFKFTTDHLHSIKRGGKVNSLKNLLPSCNCCNSRKGELSLEEFREYAQRMLTHQPGIKDLPFTKKLPRLWKVVDGVFKFYGELVKLGYYVKDFEGPNPFLN